MQHDSVWRCRAGSGYRCGGRRAADYGRLAAASRPWVNHLQMNRVCTSPSV